MAKIWIKSEIDYLMSNYVVKGAVACSTFLSRTVSAVKSKYASEKKKIVVINPTGTENSGKKWTVEEINYLMQNFIEKGAEVCAAFLLRTVSAIKSKYTTEKRKEIVVPPPNIKVEITNYKNFLYVENEQEFKLLATVKDLNNPSNNVSQEVIWTSSSPWFIEVDKTGVCKVKPDANGSAVISATSVVDPTKKFEHEFIIVKILKVVSVDMPSVIEAKLDTDFTFNATVVFKNGSTLMRSSDENLNLEVISDDLTIVNETSVVHTITYKITGKYSEIGEKNVTFSFNISASTPVTVKINVTTIPNIQVEITNYKNLQYVENGQEFKLLAVVKDLNNPEAIIPQGVTWNSSSVIATIDNEGNCKVHPGITTYGSAFITATSVFDPTKNFQYKITIVKILKVKSIDMPDVIDTSVDTDFIFNSTVVYNNGFSLMIPSDDTLKLTVLSETWRSEDQTNTAIYEITGKYTEAGEKTVVFSFGASSKTKTLKINVN